MSRLTLILLLLTGCARPGPLGMMYEQTNGHLNQTDVDEWAMACAPRELALAQAHKAFAELEFQQGDDRRAEQHLLIARENAKNAVIAADACRPRDRDGDGYVDNEDDCPDEAETFNDYLDEDGCPEGDRDGDGIFDADDACPDAKEDPDGFQDQDGCPDADNDNDGLIDAEDDCPDEPEDFDGDEDEDGCPDAAGDTDGDGIVDSLDRCISEPETFNQYLDEDGCPDEAPQFVRITEEKIEIDQRIQFESGKSVIKPISYPILDSVAQVMGDYPDLRVLVEGHTDSDGSESYNMRLSNNRAASVRDYLIQQGVSAERLDSLGYGETRPIDTNRTPEGKLNNRRVEFRILEGM
ncbi:MAG: OmpA family protein [Myxococcota bacterium]